MRSYNLLLFFYYQKASRIILETYSLLKERASVEASSLGFAYGLISSSLEFSL